MKNFKMVDIDGAKLKMVLTQRNIQMADLSRELGYAKGFIHNVVDQGRMRQSVVNYLKAVYNIQPELYIKKEEPKQKEIPIVINDENEAMKYIETRLKEMNEKLDRIIKAFEL